MTTTSPLRRSDAAVVLMSTLLVLSGAAHLPGLGHHLAEAPYAGLAFAGYAAVTAVLAASLLVRPTRAAVHAAGLLSATAIGAYALSRSVALPGLAHDVGAWRDPNGVLAVTAEALVVAVVVALRRPRADQQTHPARLARV